MMLRTVPVQRAALQDGFKIITAVGCTTSNKMEISKTEEIPYYLKMRSDSQTKDNQHYYVI